mgnify:CR=1 FL=1|tara:strand:- start:467 stop:688 length:222 start_codon:yes stop_codon:yes gene_type:complete
MKKTILILSLLFIGLSAPLIAQPPDPGGGGGNPPCFPPPCIPIDGGLSWLLLAGVAYGGKKFHDMNKKNEGEV